MGIVVSSILDYIPEPPQRFYGKRDNIQTGQVTIVPASLTISDAVFYGETVTISLNQPPKGTVKLFIQTDDKFTADSCMLEFTPTSYLSKNFVLNSGSAISASRSNLNFTIRMVFEATSDCDLHNRTIDYPVNRIISPAKQFASAGDPHFTTFDGFAYTLWVWCFVLFCLHRLSMF